MPESRKHIISILQALLVTFLWSTSYVIIKKGLISIPPITFAGLRYSMATIFLLPFSFLPSHKVEIRNLSKGNWLVLILLGLVYYVFTQGIQFVGLSLLPSTTVSLMLNFTPVIVVILGIVFVHEKPSARQVAGIFVFIFGTIFYFIPLAGIKSQYFGLAIMIIGVVSNGVSAVLGRTINRRKNISPFTVTLISMASGSAILLLTGLMTEELPILTFASWLSLLWLSIVNTALAFTLWNHTLRNLTAMESSIINGTMLIQIALLSWIFLGETLSGANIVGMMLASAGAVAVQLRQGSKDME